MVVSGLRVDQTPSLSPSRGYSGFLWPKNVVRNRDRRLSVLLDVEIKSELRR